MGATTNAPRTPALRGDPISPVVDVREKTFVRYIYEGGTLTRGRLCLLPTGSVTALDVLRALVDDGVDLKRFYACVYETEASGGGWLPVLRTLTELPAHVDAAADNFEIPAIAGARIDVQPVPAAATAPTRSPPTRPPGRRAATSRRTASTPSAW